MTILMPSVRLQFGRFLLVGLANTFATYAVFVALGMVLAPAVGYTIAYAIGLLWTVFGTSRCVFRARWSWRVVAFGAWYLALYALGRLVLEWTDPVGFKQLVLASALLLIGSVPLSFAGGRFLLAPTTHGPVPTREGSHS